MQRSTKKIKPEVDYRQFRFKKMNTPEFSHVKLLLFWPFFGLMFMFLERFQPERHYYVVHCALDDLIPFWEWALIPYLLWFVFLIGALIYTFFFDTRAFRRMMHFAKDSENRKAGQIPHYNAHARPHRNCGTVCR